MPSPCCARSCVLRGDTDELRLHVSALPDAVDRHAHVCAVPAPLRVGPVMSRTVTSSDVAREFRRMGCRGSAMDALSNEPLRRLLELRARIRAEHDPPAAVARDGKSRAANDTD